MPADVSQLLAFAARAAAVVPKVNALASADVAKVVQQTTELAKANAPVLTGGLRDSITGTASGLSGVVQTSLRYSEFVEFGSGHGPPQPYLIPAGEAADAALGSALEISLTKAVQL